MVLIGLIGSKGSGKSTVAEYLCSSHDYTEYAFATHLKNIAKTAFDIPNDYLYGDKKEEYIPEYNKTARQIMQLTGDIFKDTFGSDFYVNKIENVLKRMKRESDVVISDIRFQNEYDLVKKYGGIIIKIVSNRNAQTDTHRSETEFLTLEPNITIHNDASIQSLYDKVEDVMQSLK
jgi:GTPase SAR1 family protein